MHHDSPELEREFVGQLIGLDLLVLGRHATPTDFARCLRLRFTNTHGLVPHNLWNIDRASKLDDESNSLTIRLRAQEDLASVEIDGMRIKIELYAPVASSHSVRGDILTIKPEIDVYIQFPNLVGIVEARQLWDDLELFWSLMTGNVSELIVALISQDAVPQDDSFSHIATPCIGVIRADADNAECFGDLFSDLMGGEHARRLSDVLLAWLKQRAVLRLGSELLIDTWNKSVSWESKLGIIAQALEAFHRTSTHQQTFIDLISYATVEKPIVAAISSATSDADLRTSLKKRMEFGNQVSLRRRTKDLMRAMPAGLRDVFGKKWQALADEMVEARNAIIHRDPSTPARDFRETVRITGHFILTVHVAILQTLGVPDDVIVSHLHMQEPYQSWLSYRR
jgi:hypothetical protein